MSCILYYVVKYHRQPYNPCTYCNTKVNLHLFIIIIHCFMFIGVAEYSSIFQNTENTYSYFLSGMLHEAIDHPKADACNTSPFLKSYIHKLDGKSHPSPQCPLCNTHTHIHDTHHLFNCTHIRTTLSPMDLWTDPTGVMELLTRWRDKLAGGPKRDDRTPPPH